MVISTPSTLRYLNPVTLPDRESRFSLELVAGQLRIQEEYRKMLVLRAKRSVEEQIITVPCVPGGTDRLHMYM